MAEKQTVATFLTQSEQFYQQCSKFYKQLDNTGTQIRLMNIQPAAFEEENIHITLSEADLKDQPEFETISYAWGDMLPTKEVLIHDLPYSVTVNQYEALRRLRYADKVRTMWMDVICIDQANLSERAHQVSIMGQIYTNSALTVIWLGEPRDEWFEGITEEEWATGIMGREDLLDDPEASCYACGIYTNEVVDSKRADHMLNFRKICEGPKSTLNGARYILDLLAKGTHYYDLPAYDMDENGKEGDVIFYRPWFESMKLLVRILDLTWWHRVWVIQEVLLCKGNPMVMFGEEYLPLEKFMAAGESALHHLLTKSCCKFSAVDIVVQSWSAMFIRTLTSLGVFAQTRRHEPAGQMHLVSAANLARSKDATDARDYVYGILGLVKPDARVPVDYEITTAEVFMTASWKVFTTNNSFHLLEQSGMTGGKKFPDVPSWSLDWTNILHLHFKYSWTFVWHKDEVPDWDQTRLNRATGRIDLQANKLDTIKVMLETLANSENVDTYQALGVKRVVNHWVKQLHDLGFEGDFDHHKMTRANMPELAKDLFVTIFRDTKPVRNDELLSETAQRFGDAEWDDVVNWWVNLNKLIDEDPNAENPNVDEDEDGDNVPRHIRDYPKQFPVYLTEPFTQALSTSSLAVTEKGKLCLVPSPAQTGDPIYHIRSCRVPLVLRSMADSPQSSSDPVNVTKNPAEFQLLGGSYLHGAMGSAGWVREAEELIQLR